MTEVNWTKYTIDQLKEMLVKTGKFSMDDLSEYKRKIDLVELLEGDDDEVEFSIEPSVLLEQVEKTKIPRYDSPEWNSYVLALLEPDEVDELGNPLLHGLRRLSELLLGNIVFSGPIELKASPPDDRDCGWATCVYKVEFAWRDSYGTSRVFIAAADAHKNNLESKIYAKFPVAMAEARAEGRALRKALGIKVVTSEELSEIKNKDDYITKQQLTLITAKCGQLGIGIEKFFPDKPITSATMEQGAKLINDIKNYQLNPKSIPEELKNESIIKAE